jgi:PleD family two-component response regulator
MDQSNVGRIMVVEDNVVNRKLLGSLLGRQGYRTVEAEDGERAVALAQADPPDLVLLDIMMPKLDGYATCAALKEDPRTRDVPVIFISTLDQELDKVRAFSAGGVDYISKPFQVQEVYARVRTHLAIRQLQRELEQRVADLEEALSQVRTLKGLLPICARCKAIRDDKGYWQKVETYVMAHSEAEFSHGLCPQCARELYPELYEDEEQPPATP